LAAALCVKAFIAFLQRHDFRVFGWYRIVAGIVILAVLWQGSA
jgi:undecaprenyl-diphosphatase